MYPINVIFTALTVADRLVLGGTSQAITPAIATSNTTSAIRIRFRMAEV